MNSWLDSPEARRAEAASFQAEMAERQGRIPEASALYLSAANDFEAAAHIVPETHPNTRGDLGIAAVACFARAGNFAAAIRAAERLLAQPGRLAPAGEKELTKMLQDYRRKWGDALSRPNKPPVFNKRRASSRGPFEKAAA
jgi:hypothetical protein